MMLIISDRDCDSGFGWIGKCIPEPDSAGANRYRPGSARNFSRQEAQQK